MSGLFTSEGGLLVMTYYLLLSTSSRYKLDVIKPLYLDLMHAPDGEVKRTEFILGNFPETKYTIPNFPLSITHNYVICILNQYIISPCLIEIWRNISYEFEPVALLDDNAMLY